MTALALILSAFVAAMGLLAIFFPGRADDVARLFADKTGLWVATAIRAVLALGLFAAAGESKAPILLRILGGLHFDRRRRNATARLRSTSTNDRLVARQKSNHSNRLGRSRFRSGRVSDLRDYLAQLREKHRHQVAGRGQHGKCSLRMHASRHQLHHTGSEAESAHGNHNQLNIRVSLFRRRDQRLHCYSGAAPRRSRRGSYQCEARKHRSSK